VTHHKQKTNLGVRLFTFGAVLFLSERINGIVWNACFCFVAKKLIFFIINKKQMYLIHAVNKVHFPGWIGLQIGWHCLKQNETKSPFHKNSNLFTIWKAIIQTKNCERYAANPVLPPDLCLCKKNTKSLCRHFCCQNYLGLQVFCNAFDVVIESLGIGMSKWL